ncbi:hypothetical protein H0H93_004854 [Arthromyces matolae]|nr:hypothetical protein H0H93_004854 [Arthromyces matolae]
MDARLCLSWLVYTLLGLVADAIEFIIVACRPHTVPRITLQNSPIDDFTNEQVLERIRAARRPGVSETVLLTDLNITARLSVDGDRTNLREVLVHELLLAKTTIPVPRVRRVVAEGNVFYVVADYIPGQTLAAAWSSLSLVRKLSIAFTLRSHIRQLRTIKATSQTPAGCLTTESNRPRKSFSVVWGLESSRQGPFESYTSLIDFMNYINQVWADLKSLPDDSPLRRANLDFSRPMVLTHNDLHNENIILGDDGRVWIIDWTCAAYHPEWFELIGNGPGIIHDAW